MCFKVTLGILRQQPSGRFQRAMVANAGEHIQNLPLLRMRVCSSVCSNHWQPEASRHFHHVLIAYLVLTTEVALHLGVRLLLSKQEECRLQRRAALGACEAHQTFGMRRNFFRSGSAFAFCRAKFQCRNQPAEVLISALRFAQQRLACAVSAGDFRADMCPYAEFLRCQMLAH